MNRQEDLSKVFDRTWTANHNDMVKKAREKDKAFMDRMFNVNRGRINNQSKVVTPEMQVNELNKKMNENSNFQRQVKVNNILNRWK